VAQLLVNDIRNWRSVSERPDLPLERAQLPPAAHTRTSDQLQGEDKDSLRTRPLRRVARSVTSTPGLETCLILTLAQSACQSATVSEFCSATRVLTVCAPQSESESTANASQRIAMQASCGVDCIHYPRSEDCRERSWKAAATVADRESANSWTGGTGRLPPETRCSADLNFRTRG